MPTKTLILILLLSLACQAQQFGSSQYGDQFPDAPEPVKKGLYGGWVHDRDGDPPKQKTFTNRFVIAHSVYLASIVYDVEVTHAGIAHHNCQEGNPDLASRPSRGDLYSSNLLEYGVMTAFDLLIQSRHFEKKQGWVAYIGSSYGTAVHLKAGTKWLTGCW